MKTARAEKSDKAPIVVVGTGPAGIRAAEKILSRGSGSKVVLYGDEPWDPYNRVRLSSYLAGEAGEIDLQLHAADSLDSRIIKRYNCRVTWLDRERKLVEDESGRRQPYSKLVLATGSKPHIPNIPGVGKKGVYTFRSMSDAVALMERGGHSRNVVVLGGGLLGLEAARAMQRFAASVTVIEHNKHLMFKQLDEQAGDYVLQHVESLGIRVLLSERIVSINGEKSVDSVTLGGGGELGCDTLILATGIRPNVQLAVDGGLSVNRGIRVDDRMRTSDHDIYAVGECIEHRDVTYGLVVPGYEQAAIAAHNITGGLAVYRGSVQATSLKVLGLKVFSMGQVVEDLVFHLVRGYVHVDSTKRLYRKLLIRRGHMVGVIAIGEWSKIGRIQEAVMHERRIWSWQLRRFSRSGSLWPSVEAGSVADWPDAAIICNCTGVTSGQIGRCLAAGHAGVADIAAWTGASTVCGSCKPLLHELCGAGERQAPVSGYRMLGFSVGAALLLAMTGLLSPAISYSETVRVSWQWDMLWRESLFKQVSGFALVGFVALTIGLSLRKRLNLKMLGRFDVWRIVHTLAGVVTLLVLVAHSGFRIGYNLNFLLMTCFIGVVLAGTVFGGVVAFEHRARPALARNLKSFFGWAHILLFWPLPVLLIFHVLKTYYY